MKVAVAKVCRACRNAPAIRRGLSTRLCGNCLAKPALQHENPLRPTVPAYQLTRAAVPGVTRPSLEIAKGNHRNRSLLDLAHELHDCTNCGKHVPEGLEPAHENSQEAGKGFGIKSCDHRHAALCHECHAWLDQGGKRSPCGDWAVGQKQFMWDRAHKRTFDEYWKRNWLKVA